MCLLINSGVLSAHEIHIDFEGLAGFAVRTYIEDGMTFTPIAFPHFHVYPDPTKALELHPEQDRSGIRMMFDPNRDGIPDGRFNLKSLYVRRGQVNVHAEIDYSAVNGAVYGPLPAGVTWILDPPGNTDLLFVDFWMSANSSTAIDNVVVEHTHDGSSVPKTSCDGQTAILGTPGDDTIYGTWRPDVIHGGGGHDTIIGFGGADRICGGAGNDTIYGGSGPNGYDDGSNDRLFGNGGDDSLDGGDNTADFCDGGSHVGRDTAVNCETRRNIP
jgi:hypothetical protein